MVKVTGVSTGALVSATWVHKRGRDSKRVFKTQGKARPKWQRHVPQALDVQETTS
jgi:hypothetical protein